jgi:hypothetical protein
VSCVHPDAIAAQLLQAAGAGVEMNSFNPTSKTQQIVGPGAS